ncbi:hypothetical protein L227DRAFT_505146 [Lentinus tigrinus ALCF2SS1-6]|uniref:Uncharacterized protein n=1 Tax=Lentinus tigrinus ALCF2SS1-6 TaxID=1328759 RepID=A0A5C2SAV8_9APHY|nr:hypothetical protein L227DRAFT_505146 [Lentinus tigrinus ALCF2SS1-6]
MPVTFQVAPHPAEDYKRYFVPQNAEDVLESSCRDQWMQCTDLLQSSVTTGDLSALVPKNNGFVEAVLAAYKQHHHLKIRPDDVWMSILSQLNFYINTHAEELREHFVAHQDKVTLTVSAVGNRYTVDFGDMARQMTLKIQDKVVDRTLVDWILPNFTTTTVKDTTVCAVMMMSSFKSYFNYRMMCMCGIPSVTLEGERADWEKLLARLDRIPELGEEPAVWAGMLRPILTRFLAAFDGEPDIKFWSDVVHSHPQFYGPEDMSGWISAFCVWSSKGTWQAGALSDITNNDASRSAADSVPLSKRYLLDGISYPALSASQIPHSYCEVDVLLDDNGTQFECMMVAGLVGFSMSSSGTGQSKSILSKNDTLSPAAHWFMFVKGKRELEDSFRREHRNTGAREKKRQDVLHVTKPRKGLMCTGCVIA